MALVTFFAQVSVEEKLEERKRGAGVLGALLPAHYSALPASTLHDHLAVLEEMVLELFHEALPFEDRREFSDYLRRHLPLVRWQGPKTAPDVLSLKLVARASTFLPSPFLFAEFIRRTLLPAGPLPLISFNHLVVQFEGVPEEKLFVAEIKLLVATSHEQASLNYLIPTMVRELEHALSHPHLAEQLLEMKPMAKDLKLAFASEKLRRFLLRFSQHFEGGILEEASRFFALRSRDFLDKRSLKHLIRIIAGHHLIGVNLQKRLALHPAERQALLYLVPTTVRFSFGSKEVMGLLIGLILPDPYEQFGEEQMKRALIRIFPTAQVVKGSFISVSSQGPLKMIYAEIEHSEGMRFSADEGTLLREKLPQELLKCVEKLAPAISLKTQEEEVMRHIFLLSRELKFPNDVPQMVVLLDRQTATHLIFTVILLRLLKKGTEPLETAFQMLETESEIEIERAQVVSYLRDLPKEANVFRLRLPLECVLQHDGTIDFYAARMRAIELIERAAASEVRDYNGGLILQQMAQLSEFRDTVALRMDSEAHLIEEFFYSITPMEEQATAPLDATSRLFQLMVEVADATHQGGKSYTLREQEEEKVFFLVLSCRTKTLIDLVQRQCGALYTKAILSARITWKGMHLMGFLARHEEGNERELLLNTLRTALIGWEKRAPVMKLCVYPFPSSFDPRIGGDEDSKRVLRFLFEGLLRRGTHGELLPALAESYEISPDGLRYLFRLRKAHWSNGDPIVAEDFVYSWKKMLSPDFMTPFAYLFFPIKHAREAKEGKVSVEEIGVRSLDEGRLLVTLEHPTPFFLELLTLIFFSPVNQRVDTLHPNWAEREGEGYVCSGPFLLKQRTPQRIHLTKNARYWQAEEILMEEVDFVRGSSDTAISLFERDEIHWVGRPHLAWNPRYNAIEGGEKVHDSSYSVLWYVFNTKHFPFNHPKLRRALAGAIDRDELLKELSVPGKAAYTPLPEFQSLALAPRMSREEARALFQEALAELDLKQRDFPPITLLMTPSHMQERSAHSIKAQWEEVLGLRCTIERDLMGRVFKRLHEGNFEVCSIYWVAWINDPIYTLNAFRYAHEKINFPHWENPTYQAVLDSADQERDPELRLQYLAAAESILINEMPVMPIYYEPFFYVKKPFLQVAVDQKRGHVDLTRAFFTRH